MSKSVPLVERGEALRGVEALAGDEAAAELARSEEAEPAAPSAPGSPGALGGHAAKGFAFMLTQSLATRFIAFGAQIALAHLLLKEHFGLIALADTIGTFANVLQLIGIKEILVARQKKFDLWSNAAFWITVTTGLATGVIVAISAPIAAWAFKQPDIAGLLLITAISLPIWAVQLVPEARVQSQMRFKLIAGIVGMQSTLTPALTVLLAFLGFGAYSFVIPRLIVGIVRSVILFRATSFRLTRDPQRRRWRFIIAQSAMIFFTSLLLLIVQVGERPVLGLFVDADTVGLYYFAYMISLQTIMMLSVNLDQILFATLAKLQDEPARLLRAFDRASRTLAAIVVPLCLIQAAVSDAAVHTIFESSSNPGKWYGAVLALQILGVGMIFPGAYCPANSMLQASQRFRTRFYLSLANAIAYMASVVAGAMIGLRLGGSPGAITGVALAVSICQAIMNPIWSYITTRPFGGTWTGTIRIMVRPTFAGLVAVAVGITLGELSGAAVRGNSIVGVPLEHWVRLFVTGGVSVLAYIPLARVLMPEPYREVGAKLVAAVRRVSPRAAGNLGRMAGVT